MTLEEQIKELAPCLGPYDIPVEQAYYGLRNAVLTLARRLDVLTRLETIRVDMDNAIESRCGPEEYGALDNERDKLREGLREGEKVSNGFPWDEPPEEWDDAEEDDNLTPEERRLLEQVRKWVTIPWRKGEEGCVILGDRSYVPREELDEAHKWIKELEAKFFGAPDESYRPKYSDKWRDFFFAGRCITELSREALMDAVCVIPNLLPLTLHGKPPIIDAIASLPEDFVGWSPELEPWFSALEEMAACLSQEQLAYMIQTRTGFVPKERLDVAETKLKGANERAQIVMRHFNEELARRRELEAQLAERVAEVRRYNWGLANESQEYQERLGVAKKRIKELCEEQRKTASFWERIRIKAATESNARIHELEAQLAERDADAEVGRATPRLCDGPRFGNFFGKAETMEIAQYAADAEVGKAIRELRPKEGHLWAEVDVVSFHVPTTTAYAIQWCDSMAHWKSPDTTALHDDLADAIREYNERED